MMTEHFSRLDVFKNFVAWKIKFILLQRASQPRCNFFFFFSKKYQNQISSKKKKITFFREPTRNNAALLGSGRYGCC